MIVSLLMRASLLQFSSVFSDGTEGGLYGLLLGNSVRGTVGLAGFTGCGVATPTGPVPAEGMGPGTMVGEVGSVGAGDGDPGTGDEGAG